MHDKSEMKLERLLTVAREERVDTGTAEEFFETRLMAKIRELRETPPWYALVWRMIPLFALLAVVIAVGTLSFNPSRRSDMFAALTGNQEIVLAGCYLAGE
jgi:hypothetical protein